MVSAHHHPPCPHLQVSIQGWKGRHAQGTAWVGIPQSATQRRRWTPAKSPTGRSGQAALHHQVPLPWVTPPVTRPPHRPTQESALGHPLAAKDCLLLLRNHPLATNASVMWSRVLSCHPHCHLQMTDAQYGCLRAHTQFIDHGGRSGDLSAPSVLPIQADATPNPARSQLATSQDPPGLRGCLCR